MPQNDKALLQRLHYQQVQFVVIGGVCSVLHGVSVMTFDLDICCQFSRENLRRIEAAVKDLHPRYRLTANKLPFELTDELCDRLKNIYLTTDFGVLDCLSDVTGLGNFEQVLQLSIPCRMSGDEFPILSLDALIASKEAVGREKDFYAARLLRAIKPKN